MRLRCPCRSVGPAFGQDRTPSHCIALARAEPRSCRRPCQDGLEPDTVLIRYLDHASFAIVTADGTVAVTDYTGYLGTQDIVPDVVTMNNAHDTHWTSTPDPRIVHVLKGWPVRGRNRQATGWIWARCWSGM
jgi:hypothetical protein